MTSTMVVPALVTMALAYPGGVAVRRACAWLRHDAMRFARDVRDCLALD